MIAPAIPENEADRIAALYELRILDTPPEDRFDRITQLASKLFNVPIAYLALVDSDRQWLKSRCGINLEETTREVSFCGHTILGDGVMVVTDALEDDRFHDNPMVTDQPKIRFYAGMPLQSADGQKIGTLCLADREPREFSHSQHDLLRDLSCMAEDQLNLLNVIDLQSKLRETKKDLERSNTFIRQVFGRYVADEVAEKLLENPESLKMGGECRDVTAMMTDLRGFTPMTEKLSAEQVVDILNRFLGHMVEVIGQYGGTIDNFIGDAILVVFGAPTDCEDAPGRAVACAIEMQQRMAEVNQENRETDLPEIAMGIGIATGEAVAGNIGSDRRAKYSVIGSTVNLAARIESFTVGGQILIAESAREACGDDIRIDGSLRVKLKGIDRPVRIYEVGAIGSPWNVSLDPPAEE